MALRQVLLSRRIEEQRAALTTLREGEAALAVRRAEIHKREAELEEALREVTEETSAEDKAALDEETAKWEQEEAALAGEETENKAEREKIEGKIAQLEEELRAMNERAKAAARGVPAARGNERTEETNMNTRKKFFGMTMQERDAFLAREDVKGFLTRVRELGKQERAVSGAELLIPTVVLDLVRENTAEHSQLLQFVNARPVSGSARQGVMGTIPEAIWTEMRAKLNEINLTFNMAEVDGYMVAGYAAVPNATLQDSDIALGSEIIAALGKAIGIALDKAILYGTGTKMPLGIVTRLAQTSAPSNYPAAARAWADLHTSNIKTIAAAHTGTALFKEIIKAAGAAKKKYGAKGKFFAMNETTYALLKAEALSVNAAGAIVAGMDGTMPIVGGKVVELDFIPDNVIIGGYGELYLLAEREGTSVNLSEHAHFVEHQTVYKAVARYDGLPVIAEGFVAIGLNAATVSASAVTFTADAANAAASGSDE